MSTFRFAIMGAGNIAHQFCDAVTLVEDCEVSAIASKDLDAHKNLRRNARKPCV